MTRPLSKLPQDAPLPSPTARVTRGDVAGAASESWWVIAGAALCVAGLVWWTWFGGLFG